MIALIVITGYVLVSILTARATLRLIMTRPVCTAHRKGWFTGRCYINYHNCGLRTAPLGELVDRSASIGLASLGFGFLWPATLLLLFVMHAPPTPDEMARSSAEMSDRIRQLERDIARKD